MLEQLMLLKQMMMLMKLKVVNVKPKYEFEKIGKTKEIDPPKEEPKEETQISFEDFTNSFKI